MKSRYWACSKFADWLRGTQKPYSATAEEWAAWEKTAKTKKFRYWLAENGLDYLQNFIYWPADRINDARCYVHNRWIIKSHAITSNLKRGRWHDFESRLLHAAFDEFVNVVEIELAWMFVVSSKEERKKYKTPWYRTVFRMGLWRCPEAGTAYLKWASELKNDEDWVKKNDPNYWQPTHQALAAQEIFLLYQWWKEERPKRVDPGEVSGLSAYYEEKRNVEVDNKDLLSVLSTNNMKDERLHRIFGVYDEIEKEQNEEDTAMLIRLVKIRQSLWT